MAVHSQIDIGDDGDAVRAIRQIKAQLDGGLISRAEYMEAYRAIDRGVGKRCDCCDQPPAVFKRGRQSLCASCYLVAP